MTRLSSTLAICIGLFANSPAFADEDREAKVAADKQQFDSEEGWLYNKLDQAYAQARQTGKPIMAVLRCIPCEECVKLDDDLIDNDPAIASLLGEFIRVRLTGTNGLDLKTFQYDTDQSFAIFFLNADKIVYGRFGTRSHRTEWVTDVSVEGMARAMEGALALHARYPANRGQLVGKSNQPTEFATPEEFPKLNKKPGRLNWEGKDFAKGVVKNCIHCHEISEARLELHWQNRRPIPETLLYPYPHPKSIGLVLDPKHRVRVIETQDDSPAKLAGLRPGDDILRMNGQPLISMADVQWVLHHLSPEGARVDLQLRRAGQLTTASLTLGPGWRRLDDTSWRTGHWILRRSMLGGMKLKGLRSQPDDPTGTTASLKVEYVGTWGPFGVANRAGVQTDDLIVSVDGRDDFQRESEVFEYINQNKRAGEHVELVLLRNGAHIPARYKIQ
jgi:serine protease Do